MLIIQKINVTVVDLDSKIDVLSGKGESGANWASMWWQNERF